jgi:hypothetical protein
MEKSNPNVLPELRNRVNMARKKALWEQHYLIWGKSARTGRTYKIRTRSDNHVAKLFDKSTKCAIIFNNSMCMSLKNHKGIPREEIESELQDIKEFWDKMKNITS